MYSPDPVDRNQLVDRHVPLVKRIAYHLLGRLPADVQVDDLIQAGVVGLLEAARQYDAGQGASFETYAGIRIRGAMLDEVRRSDWTPRSVHRNGRRVSTAMRAVEHRQGREARPQEVAEELGVELDEYQRMVADTVSCRVLSFEDMFEPESEGENRLPGSEPDPLEQLQAGNFRDALAQEVDALPEREKLVMSLYYDDELNLREIGEVLGVSESRVCQLHGQALVRLRARMADWTGRDSDR
ncbi:RNA polymerase sigma factor FliA [Thioalkalivibrio sp.]|uniref:RNA polymerase sigma factor FliA n=1 Tax=Thioalkalivibrio sp. TaxID=2093813 RepID=UPI003976F81C